MTFSIASIMRWALSVALWVVCPSAEAQCLLLLEGDPAVQRSGPNEERGTATIDPSQTIQGNWSVTLNSVLLFTPVGGSESTVMSASTSFNWGPGTPTGTGSS